MKTDCFGTSGHDWAFQYIAWWNSGIQKRPCATADVYHCRRCLEMARKNLRNLHAPQPGSFYVEGAVEYENMD